MRIKIADIKENMVLARDLVQNGTVVWAKGSILTSHSITILSRRGIRAVDVEMDTAVSPEGMAGGILTREDPRHAEAMRMRVIVDRLFDGAGTDEAQLQMLRYCVIGQLEEMCREEE
jgi:hypothetical protein